MLVASRLDCWRYLFVLTLLFTGAVSYAQYSGNIHGVVSDPAGAAVDGARVQLRNVDTGVTASTATAGAGNYRFSTLPPGNYVVSAEAGGFRGWELTSIAVAQTGTPSWVVWDGSPISCDDNNDDLGYDIPDRPSSNFTGSPSRQAYRAGIFKTTDFPVPASGQEGNLPINIYRNPGLVQIDASVLKNSKLPWLDEQCNLQFRFDFLNVINRVNLGAVNNNLADAQNFGKVTSALSGRQIQLGARVSF